ncbi:MAG: RidA family protein [Ignavibacteria bacterium]|jgi:enamine deaminase RidA (YjgF/YER057c/UK114 family)
MILKRIADLGYEIPKEPEPLASYLRSLEYNGLVYTAGQLPLLKGKLLYKGKVGKDVSENDAIEAARICVLNCLSVIKYEIEDLNKIDRIVKVTVFVNSAEGFTNQPIVANGASDFLVQVFGDKGKHVRSAVGVNELPLNSCIEVELVAGLKK